MHLYKGSHYYCMSSGVGHFIFLQVLKLVICSRIGAGVVVIHKIIVLFLFTTLPCSLGLGAWSLAFRVILPYITLIVCPVDMDSRASCVGDTSQASVPFGSFLCFTSFRLDATETIFIFASRSVEMSSLSPRSIMANICIFFIMLKKVFFPFPQKLLVVLHPENENIPSSIPLHPVSCI